MNYVDDRTVPLCTCCGDETPAEQLLDDCGELVCAPCFAASQQVQQHSVVIEFRRESREWLKCSSCMGNGLHRGDGEFGFCHCHAGAAAAAAHAARGELYRGTYDGRAAL